MTSLECSVTNCMHNADHRCCKQAIVVDGHEAKEKEETCCGSFDENRDGFFKNIFKSPENRLEIDCEASNCIYNEGRHCHADKIGIRGEGAACCGDTLCDTFKTR